MRKHTFPEELTKCYPNCTMRLFLIFDCPQIFCQPTVTFLNVWALYWLGIFSPILKQRIQLSSIFHDRLIFKYIYVNDLLSYSAGYIICSGAYF